MTIALNVATDFVDVVDGLEAVTFLERGGGTTQAITKALRRQISRREAEASNGKYQASDTIWHVSQTELASQPQPGATITDGEGTIWTALESSRDTLTSRWRCVCRNLAIAAGLDQLITIQKANWQAGRGGDAQPNYSDWKLNVPASIQPMDAAINGDNQLRHADTRYSIRLAVDHEITADHRVKDVDGNVYKIESFADKEQLGQFMVLVARRVPWPFA